MNKLLLTTAIILVMGGSSVWAHHPAADSVPAEIYEMINENISEQHLALDFDEMDRMIMDDNEVGTENSTSAGVERSEGMGNAEDVGAAALSADPEPSYQAEINGSAERNRRD